MGLPVSGFDKKLGRLGIIHARNSRLHVCTVSSNSLRQANRDKDHRSAGVVSMSESHPTDHPRQPLLGKLISVFERRGNSHIFVQPINYWIIR